MKAHKKEMTKIEQLNIGLVAAPILRDTKTTRKIFRTNSEGKVIGEIDSLEMSKRLLVKTGVDFDIPKPKVIPTIPQARLSVDIPETLLRKLKIQAAERGVTIRELILEILKKEGWG